MRSPFAPTIVWRKHQDPSVWRALFEHSRFRFLDLRWSPLYPLGRWTSNRAAHSLTASHFVLRFKAEGSGDWDWEIREKGRGNMKPVIVLIHSPLVGPFTWALVAETLRQQGIAVVLPALISPPAHEKPYWQHHADAVVQALEDVPAQQPVLLAGHSGAGPLLPAIRQAIMHPLAGYLFVDAGWPVNGKSRLDLFEDAEAVAQFRQSAQHGLLPAWTGADLQPVIPDNAVRQRFVSELRPLPLAVYEEALPVFSGWPDAPCAYLRFGDNPAYDTAFTQAQQRGCPWMKLEGAHFHMLVNPQEVADALRDLAAQMGLDL